MSDFGFYEFCAVVKHDKGKTRITTWATDEDAARRIIQAAEGCPARSIIEIKKAA